MTVFRLPDLGEGLKEAEIVAWHVAEGDHVIAEQPLVSVETDKAVVEIPAPYSGTVLRLIAGPGDIVPTDGPLVEIDTGTKEDTGAIVGEIKTPRKPADSPIVEPRAKAKATTSRLQAAPAVRKLARELNVDLEKIRGTGPRGAILSSDVTAAAHSSDGEELRGVRRAMASAMARSHASVVPATIMDQVDIGAWGSKEDPTLRLIGAIVAACQAQPALNAWFDGTRLQLHEHVDLGIAVDTPEGLFTPVLRAADREPDIAGKLKHLKAAVENRSIPPQDLKGATISLSNFGMMAGEHAALVVPAPQVAILGAGRIDMKPCVVDGQVIPCRVLPLSLTFDHRVVTGGEAARFLDALRTSLAQASLGNSDGIS